VTRKGRVRVVRAAGLVLGAGVVLSGVAGIAAAAGEEKPAVAVTAPQAAARAASSVARRRSRLPLACGSSASGS